MAAFTLNLQRKIEPTLVVCGKFDGSHACLAAATSVGNILIHSPHRQPVANVYDSSEQNLTKRLEWNGEIAELHIGKQILSLCTGRLTGDERDLLLIGTQTHILAYQVEENADLFYKDISGGVYSITTGKLGWIPNQIIIVGSSSSITVLDSQGNEIFWTIIGEIIRSVAILDFDGDGENEIVVGNDDCEIKVFKKDLILWETKETAAVTALTPIVDRKFAYVVGNGTVGIYESDERLWRIKSKHKVVSVKCYDVNGDGFLELITGWSSGKIDARSCLNGEVIFKVQMNAGVAGIVEADYRKTGKSDLVIISTVGEVRGYAGGLLISAPETGEKIRKLLTKKQALIKEIRQQNINFQNYLSSKLAVNIFSGRGGVKISLASGPGSFIHCAIVFAEGLFDGETLVVHPPKPAEEIEIELKPEKNAAVDIHIKVCVGTDSTDLFQVFEIVRQLPRFCMYEIIPRPENMSESFKNSGVIFEISERPQRVALWFNQNFLLAEELDVAEEGPRAGFIEVWLRGMRDDQIHCIRSSSTGKTSIQTNDPQFAGDIIQSLAIYLGIQELGSEARFPENETKIIAALERLKGFEETNIKLQTDVVGISMLLKDLMIRLEDSRILNNINGMKKRLIQLNKINNDLMKENEIRLNNYKELTTTLNDLNLGIRNASKFRVGRASANTITKCRSAIDDQNSFALIQAIQNG